MTFPTDYADVLKRLGRIDPIEYGRTRNYIDGAVTRLSPYVSRGVISTKQILQSVFDRGFRLEQIEPFVKELCWRDYFQRVAQEKDLQGDIIQPQASVNHHDIPTSIMRASTGISGIDDAISGLYRTGYMHNHCRMYVASLTCNIARSHWRQPARWMYYHLLDGDWASNACSWQWVAGANSSKKYYANQQNVNTFTRTHQTGTFLDVSYEDLGSMDTPEVLEGTTTNRLVSDLPSSGSIRFNADLPTFVYNYYNLDPSWHKDQPGNRILLIDPSVFEQYPVSPRCIDFMIALGGNIPELQIYVGSFASLSHTYALGDAYYKEHPMNQDYSGIMEERDWIARDVIGYYSSFSSYWRAIKSLSQLNVRES
ncbi:MAG: deoxyribodipyrimidine photolyase [Candidatus Kapabacteria bacterium]|nr:deoxyribodipyrimidine photolyase [Candidatus Kapabacteria bacterium]